MKKFLTLFALLFCVSAAAQTPLDKIHAVIERTALSYDIPMEDGWNEKMVNVYAGGVTNGVECCMGYDVEDKNDFARTTAKKAWFCFEEFVVCMGAGISSTSEKPIGSTVVYEEKNGKVQVEEKDGNIRWIGHDKDSYCLPYVQKIAVDESGKMLRLAFLHGAMPRNAAYLFYKVPESKSFNKAMSTVGHIDVVNSPEVQMVYHYDQGILQAVAYRSIKFGVVKGASVSVSGPCAVMLTGINTNKPQLFVSDPTGTQEIVNVTVKLPHKKPKTVEVALPVTEKYSGRTVSLSL